MSHPFGPDRVAALEAQVAALEALVLDIARSNRKLRDEVVEMLTDYGVRLDELAPRTNTPAEDTDKVVSAEPWWQRATPAERDELVAWVDARMRDYQPHTRLWIPPCWPHPHHRGIAEELAAAHNAWVKATRADAETRTAGTGSDALAMWHTHVWWPMLLRLPSTQRCEACTKGNGHRDTATPPRTDRAFLTPHPRPPDGPDRHLLDPVPPDRPRTGPPNSDGDGPS